MTKFTSSSSFAVKLYQCLLRVYPSAFRQSYGMLMRQHFIDCYQLARQESSFTAMYRFWVRILAATFKTAFLERIDDMRTTRWWFWPLIVFLGLGIGYIDYTAVEVQATLLVLLPIAFCLGLAAPHQTWRCALILGLAIPVAHIIGHMLNIRPPYHDYVIASLLALIPSFLAAYTGTGLRWLVGKGLRNLVGS